MSLVTPSIDPRLTGIAPGFRALSILVKATPITQPDVASAALAQACQQVSLMMLHGRKRTSAHGMTCSGRLVRNRNARPARHRPCVSEC